MGPRISTLQPSVRHGKGKGERGAYRREDIHESEDTYGEERRGKLGHTKRGHM